MAARQTLTPPLLITADCDQAAVAMGRVTRLALSTGRERLRIWIPMALSRVHWATSSVLLHVGHRDRYPILDYRALEALGVKGHVYTISFWNAYVAACRAIDDETGLVCGSSTVRCGGGRRNKTRISEVRRPGGTVVAAMRKGRQPATCYRRCGLTVRPASAKRGRGYLQLRPPSDFRK
jgi:hypothetical protein